MCLFCMKPAAIKDAHALGNDIQFFSSVTIVFYLAGETLAHTGGLAGACIARHSCLYAATLKIKALI